MKNTAKDQELLVKLRRNVSKKLRNWSLKEFTIKDTEDTHALTIETNVLQAKIINTKEALKIKVLIWKKSIAEIEQELGLPAEYKL